MRFKMNDAICHKTISLNTGLAPMEGVTNFSMRIWLYLCSQYSFTITPFLRLTDGFSEKSLKPNYIPELKNASKLAPYSVTPQVMASNPRLISNLGSDLLKYIDYIITEISFIEIYNNQVSKKELTDFLLSNNFKLKSKCNLSKFNKQLFQEDVLLDLRPLNKQVHLQHLALL